VLYVAPDSDPTGASGAWVRALYGAVLFSWWNAPVHGSGQTSESQLDSAIELSAELLLPLYVDGKTYDLAAVNTFTEFGLTVYFALHPRSNMNIVGVIGQTTFRMADGQSTVAVPKDCNIFAFHDVQINHVIVGVVHDLNNANNTFDMATFTPHFGAYWCVGNSSYVVGLWITQCEFNNGPGSNQIITGEQTSDVQLSSNIHIWGNTFQNNGLAVSDHATVYLWGAQVWFFNNTMAQDDDLSPVGFNWVAWENHGPNQYCYNNHMNNYVKMTNTATNLNQSEGVHDIHIYDNSGIFYHKGVNIYTGGHNTPISALQDIFVHHNSIGLKPGWGTASVV
ncbi:MAG: hypothetical protein ACREHG_02110, partial [Candidatus Saccharimonadales bacterium]